MQYEKFDEWKMYITFTRTVAMSSAAHLYCYKSFTRFLTLTTPQFPVRILVTSYDC